jgi:hypothetical protein
LSERNYKEQNKLESEIEKLTENENLPYRLKVFYFINNEIIKSSSEKMENREKFISDMKNKKDASEIYATFIKPKFDPNKPYKIVSEKEITKNVDSSENKFLTQIAKDKESENYLQKILVKEKEIEKLKSSVLNGMGTDETIVFGIILFSIFFVLRYLMYATKWSIKQLKE